MLAFFLDPCLSIAVCTYFLLGGSLLYIGVQRLAKLPEWGFWKCVGIYALADLVGIGVGIAAMTASDTLQNRNLFYLWNVGVRLAVTWVILALLLRSSIKQTILAWLPTILVGGLSVLFLSPHTCARELAKRVVCQTNLKGIGTAIILYHANNQDEYPPSFKSLQSDDMRLSCPSSDSEENIDYFYMPPPQLPGHNPIIACDYLDTHPDGFRNVLHADGSVQEMTEDVFQQELAKFENAAFAEALKAAEQVRAVE